MNEITIRQPDDWHIHLRDGEALQETCKSVSRYFARAIVMPNLKPANTTVEEALAYRNRILSALPAGNDFQPASAAVMSKLNLDFVLSGLRLTLEPIAELQAPAHRPIAASSRGSGGRTLKTSGTSTPLFRAWS